MTSAESKATYAKIKEYIYILEKFGLKVPTLYIAQIKKKCGIELWRVFMRWILKIILFPISLVLSILTAFLTFLLAVGTTILYLLMLMCVVVGVVSLFQKDFSIGIEALIVGFLLSPYGIPMVGAAVIAFLQGINERIRLV